MSNLEILVEEPSMERALRHVLPRIVPDSSFSIRTFSGKMDLLKNLPARLSGYSHWVRTSYTGIVVVVDRDDDDCVVLKGLLDQAAADAGFATGSVSDDRPGEVMNRVAIEELEAWFFGDVPAIVAAYSGVPPTLASRASYRHPDDVRGGTWEALERVLQRAGHHRGGLRKLAAADDIAPHLNVESNLSPSFQRFRDGVRLLAKGSAHA